MACQTFVNGDIGVSWKVVETVSADAAAPSAPSETREHRMSNPQAEGVRA